MNVAPKREGLGRARCQRTARRIGSLCLLCGLLGTARAAVATTYYVGPPPAGNDANDGTSTTTPWATFARAQDSSQPSHLQPGDTLEVMDGRYTEQLLVKLSGEPGKPITFEAQHDGKAVVDGNVDGSSAHTGAALANSHEPVRVLGPQAFCKAASMPYSCCTGPAAGTCARLHDVAIVGFRVENGYQSDYGASNVDLHFVSHVNVRRVTAYDQTYIPSSVNADWGGNGGLIAYQSDHVVFEDCASIGLARNNIELSYCDDCAVRRCYSRYDDPDGVMPSDPGASASFVIYPSSPDGSVMENNVAALGSLGTNTSLTALYDWCNYYNTPPSGNNGRWYANVAFGPFPAGSELNRAQHLTSGSEWHDNVIIGARAVGFAARGGHGTIVDGLTVIGDGAKMTGWVSDGGYSGIDKDCDFLSDATFTNSTIENTTGGLGLLPTIKYTSGCTPAVPSTVQLTHDYVNVAPDVATPYWQTPAGAHDTHVAPDWQTSKYGKGAYLMHPANLAHAGSGGGPIGAEVLYRYVDGKKTSVPLWPWPMEARICAETGYSVTYEDGYPGCAKGGGLWKTLDGVYPPAPDGGAGDAGLPGAGGSDAGGPAPDRGVGGSHASGAGGTTPRAHVSNRAGGCGCSVPGRRAPGAGRALFALFALALAGGRSLRRRRS